jgi:hypothetical protein
MKKYKVYCFQDDLIENSLGRNLSIEDVPKKEFLNNPDKFKNSVFFVRGITNFKFFKIFKQHDISFFYIDTGYFGNLNYYHLGLNNNLKSITKKTFHRIVLNEMQLFKLKKCKDDRYKIFLKYLNEEYNATENDFLKPWKRNGNKILLCPPSNKVCSVLKINYDEWLDTTINEIKKHSKRKIEVREKPESRDARVRWNTIQEVLDNDVFILVTYNSIAATEAILHGIPALTLGNNAASAVSISKIKEIESPIYPDRKLWINNLCHQQFHVNEMSDGSAWEFLQKQLKEK